MKATYRVLIATVLVAGLLCAHDARAQIGAGVAIWKHDTGLEVDSATDFDGGNRTSEERVKEWDARGSGMGLSLTYDMPAIVSFFGELGISQVTVRDEDVIDPNRDVNTLGMDDAVYFALGVRPHGDFPNNERIFWSAGLMFGMTTFNFNEDVNVSWDYEETRFAVDGNIGYKLNGLGVFGGLRVAGYNGTLEETDISNPVGQQQRTTDFTRDGQIDLMLGAITTGGPVAGSVELGFIGAFTARTDVTYHF